MSDSSPTSYQDVPRPSFRLRIWNIIRNEFTAEQLESLHKYMKQPRRLSNPTPAALASTAFHVVDDESIHLDWNRGSVFEILEQWLCYQNRNDLAMKVNHLAEEHRLAAQLYESNTSEGHSRQGSAYRPYRRDSRRVSSYALSNLESVSEQTDFTRSRSQSVDSRHGQVPFPVSNLGSVSKQADITRNRSQSVNDQYGVPWPEDDPQLARWLEQLNAFDLKEYELDQYAVESPTHSHQKHPYRLNDLRIFRRKKPRHNTGLQPTKSYDGPGMRRDTSAKSLDSRASSGYGTCSVRSSMMSSRESLSDCLSECGNNLGSPERPASSQYLTLENTHRAQPAGLPFGADKETDDKEAGFTSKDTPQIAPFPNQFPSLPFVKPTKVLQFNAKGGKFQDKNLGVSISVPELAVPNSSILCLEVGVCLYGPFKFPNNTTPIAPVIMLRPLSETISLQKQITVTLPHIIVEATNDHIETLEIQAVKAEHNRSTVSDHYIFRDLDLHEVKVSLHSSESGEEYVNIEISHFCFISLRARTSYELAKKTGYCICPMIPTERGDITTYHLPVIHCMRPWIEALQELFLKQGYTLDKNAVITKLTFRDVENANIQGEIVDKEEGWSVKLMSGDRKGVQVIATKDVDDLWEKEQDQLEGELSLLLFPPRFSVIAIGTSATRDGFVTLRFKTTTITGDQFEHINLPLTREAHPSLSLSGEAAEPPSLKTIADNLKTIIKPIKFGVHLGIPQHVLDMFQEDKFGDLDGLNIALYTYMADNWESLGLSWGRIANSLEHVHLGDRARRVQELDCTSYTFARAKERVNQHMHINTDTSFLSQFESEGEGQSTAYLNTSREQQAHTIQSSSSLVGKDHTAMVASVGLSSSCCTSLQSLSSHGTSLCDQNSGPTCISGEIKIPLKTVFDDLAKNKTTAHVSDPFPYDHKDAYDPRDPQYQLRFLSSNFKQSSCILYIDITQAYLQRVHKDLEKVTLHTPDIELTVTVSVTPPSDPEHRNITLNKAIDRFPSMSFKLMDYVKENDPYATVSFFPNLLCLEKLKKYQERQEFLEMVVRVTMTAVEY